MTRAALIARRVREDERGMTLVELLVGLVAGMVVLLAAFMAIDAANKLSFGTTSRIEQISRGREAMERMSRAIRAQQCFGSVRPMTYASDTAMEFYSSVAIQPTTAINAQQPVQKMRLEWLPDTSADAAKLEKTNTVGDIYQTIWNGVTDATGKTTFPTITSKAIIANDVERAPDRRNANTYAPIFRYFKYAATTGSGRVDYTSPVSTAAGSAAAADLAGIVVIEVGFRVTRRGTKVTGRAAMTTPTSTTATSKPMDFYNTISVRIADPTNPGGSPQCL